MITRYVKTLAFGALLGSISVGQHANAKTTLYIGIDIQVGFIQSDRYKEKVPLGVDGAQATAKNDIALLEHAVKETATGDAHIILTKDYHYPAETFGPNQTNEFKIFGPHCMAKGIDGLNKGQLAALQEQGIGRDLMDARFIPEVEGFLEKYRQSNMILTIPNKEEQMGMMVDTSIGFFADAQNKREALNSKVIKVIQKNGDGSYDFHVNPRTRQLLDIILDSIDKTDDIEVIFFGVATNFCVYSGVMSTISYLNEKGIDANIFVVQDAIAGIPGISEESEAPLSINNAIAQMRKAGAKFVTTEKVLSQSLPL